MLIATAVMAAALVVAPHVGIYPVFLMKALCFALFACAFNLLIGFGGLLSFGHAMFLGTAGYVSAPRGQGVGHAAGARDPRRNRRLPRCWAWSSGALAIRRQGIYFAMITLALAQMMYFFCSAGAVHARRGRYPGGPARQDVRRARPRQHADDVLRRARDLPGRVPADLPRSSTRRSGSVLKAIRENEPRAISLGYDAERYKLLAFVLSATLAGLAGATKAIVFQLASLTDVHWTMSGEVVLMTLLGGMGTIFGPVVGAFTIIGLENYLADFGEWVTVITGAIFVVCVLAFRRGIVGELAAGGRGGRVDGCGSRRRALLDPARASGVAGGRAAAAGARKDDTAGQPGRTGRATRRERSLPRRPAERGLRTPDAGRPDAHRRRVRQGAAHRHVPVLGVDGRARSRSFLTTTMPRPEPWPLWYAPASRRGEPRRKLESAYSAGLLHGITRSWHANGNPRAEYRYERGELAAAQAWSETGAPLPEPRRAAWPSAIRATDADLYAQSREDHCRQPAALPMTARAATDGRGEDHEDDQAPGRAEDGGRDDGRRAPRCRRRRQGATRTPFAVAPTFIPIVGTDLLFPVRRIYCIGRNYAAHAREMGSDPTREPPFFFQKPTDAIQNVAARRRRSIIPIRR